MNGELTTSIAPELQPSTLHPHPTVLQPNSPTSRTIITQNTNMNPPCPLLDRLPLELRLEIYTYLLTFRAPLKRRQITPGARDLAVLRLNRQIHGEALGVLYEGNWVVVARNGELSLSFSLPFCLL